MSRRDAAADFVPRTRSLGSLVPAFGALFGFWISHTARLTLWIIILACGCFLFASWMNAAFGLRPEHSSPDAFLGDVIGCGLIVDALKPSSSRAFPIDWYIEAAIWLAAYAQFPAIFPAARAVGLIGFRAVALGIPAFFTIYSLGAPFYAAWLALSVGTVLFLRTSYRIVRLRMDLAWDPELPRRAWWAIP